MESALYCDSKSEQCYAFTEGIMSKRINVNPDHYKVAGRERMSNPIVNAGNRAKEPNDERARERWDKKQRKRSAR